MQDSLGLPTGALSIKRNNSGNDNLFRTPKEGSGIYQDFSFTITPEDVADGKNVMQISFNWSYLTNDATDADLGAQDFGFFTVFDRSSDLNSRFINVLDDSSGNIGTPLSSGTTNFQEVNTTFYDRNNLFTYQTTSLSAGIYNYRIGFGVVDVDGLDRSSALLIDNFNVREIPFEFSPGFGLMLMTGFFGINYYRRYNSNIIRCFLKKYGDRFI
ncbi:MAG: hypothetical protein QNJ41_07735 [Xenococcaceae cyanobacterium MO_188.B32]|nr:hypothetical protein [Xenococcaceae cyanobacterium MO_188.B32]